MLDYFFDFLSFLKMRKRFWLTPIIFTFIILAGLIYLSHGEAIAPFVYTLY